MKFVAACGSAGGDFSALSEFGEDAAQSLELGAPSDSESFVGCGIGVRSECGGARVNVVPMDVTSTVKYRLTNWGGSKVLFETTVKKLYTANFSSTFLGVKRLQLANEGSMRENIKQFIEETDRGLGERPRVQTRPEGDLAVSGFGARGIADVSLRPFSSAAPAFRNRSSLRGGGCRGRCRPS